MTGRLAIYAPAGLAKNLVNMFGKDVANLRLFQALAQWSGFEELGILTNSSLVSDDELATILLQGRSSTTRIWTDLLLNAAPANRADAVLRGLPNLVDLAWLRQRTGDRSYSLIGLVHTLAPPAIRQSIADLVTAPIQPWDALICPSPIVQSEVRNLFEAESAHIAERFGGTPPPGPHLPQIPLGVDVTGLAEAADRSDIRAAVRERLGIGADDCLVLWVGRLSFYEKAYPQPMFKALAEAAAGTDVRIHFVMLGWFPDEVRDRDFYDEAARTYAKGVAVHVLDGNDQTQVRRMWAACDIFLSLVDNIQETFGLTPLEAMAAGRPVVASDWDGYRSTIRHGIDGFLIPTLLSPQGAGRTMMSRHVLGMDSYQSYVGTVAQFTAVDVGQAAQALARLIADPGLRERMGQAGRTRARTMYDWPVVARQIHDLVEELAGIRAAFARPEQASRSGARSNPAKNDPFVDFASFATATLSKATWVSLRHADPAEPERFAALCRLDQIGARWRLPDEACQALLLALQDGRPRQMRDLLSGYPEPHHMRISLTIVWLCKLGILDWR